MGTSEEKRKDYRHVVSEQGKMRTLKKLVDECARALAEDPLSPERAQALIENTRKKALGLFRGKEEQFELIYRPRFERILKERGPK